MTVRFQRISEGDQAEAYQWHRTIADSDEHLFPRSPDSYDALVAQRSVWCARESSGDIIGMAYYAPDGGDWEVGGLMVHEDYRDKGVGSVLMRLALGTVLTELDPLNEHQRVIAHVHRDNPLPRPLIEHALKFEYSKSVQIPGELLPGLKTDDEGFVNGDEFLISVPESLVALASWCENWRCRCCS